MKKRHNFIDTPTDWCDCFSAPEDTYHFLLTCRHFAVSCLNLRSSVSNVLAVYQQLPLLDEIDTFIYPAPFPVPFTSLV